MRPPIHQPRPLLPPLQPYDFAKRSSEGLYAELPAEAISKVKSQYQHVDLLPRLPDNVYEGENRQQVVEVLNQTDPVRRVVRGAECAGAGAWVTRASFWALFWALFWACSPACIVLFLYRSAGGACRAAVSGGRACFLFFCLS